MSSASKRPAPSHASAASPPAKVARKEDQASPTLRKADRQVQWHTESGANSTLLHATYGQPQPSDKIAAFALDHCLVKFEAPTYSWQGPKDWQWNDLADVPPVKTQLQELLDDGYAILIFSSLTEPTKNRLEDFKERVGYILRDLNLPVRLLASTQYDPFRFPAPAAWLEFEKRWNGGKVIDLGESFFVGDAAGRKGQKLDYDHKFADNIGVQFYTPKNFFTGTEDTNQYQYHGWLAAKYKSDFFVLPTSTPLIPKQLVVEIDEVPPEVILFVGPPCSGKTRFYRRYFEPLGYVRLTDPEDTNTLQHLLSATVKPKSVVVDASMPSAGTRSTLARFVRAYSKADHRVRCFHFVAVEHLCKHNSVFFHLYGEEKDGQRPRFVTEDEFRDWYSRWEKPTQEEGFDEVVKRINFVIDRKGLGDEEVYKKWRSKYLNCYPRDMSGKDTN